jgi:hypothetical protein
VTCTAFEGQAGCGKTYQLLESVRRSLEEQPLSEGQRVLAITFMHGSRRRIEASLRKIPGLDGRYECSTVDSVALRWVRRWRDLVIQLGLVFPAEGEFDQICSVAAKLVCVPTVRAWLAVSFPVVLVDEAQDLTAERLAIVRALGERARTFIAGDEFQCLGDLRPNPFAEWCAKDLRPTRLTQIRRTEAAPLLAAAAALRAGGAPKAEGVLIIEETPSAALAGSYIVNAVCWYSKGGTVAILAPSLPPFVHDAVAWAQANATKQRNGPIKVGWERSEKEECGELLKRLRLPEKVSIVLAYEAIEALAAPTIAPYIRAWVDRQRNALGRCEFAKTEIEAALTRAISNRRRFGKASPSRTMAMSIHTAKNREFDGVIILWPYKLGGSDDHKRRLLYNAITRAKKWGRVFVQGKSIFSSAPFR